MAITLTFSSQNLRARTVELLGSWDNFNKAYPMKLDTRRGGDQWTGCYTFDDITLDGEGAISSEVRSGGLKMGGTYWYYYSLDGGLVETHNEAEPHTTSCPLLPGQCVNVLEVPYEDFSGSQKYSECQTLDPQDRYTNPRPAPKPTQGLPRLETSISDGPRARAGNHRTRRDLRYSATADGHGVSRTRLAVVDNRRIHTAGPSPTSAVKSALAFFKNIDVAMSPSEGGRGRSRTQRPDPSKSPPERIAVSSPTLLYRTDNDREHVSLREAQLSAINSPVDAIAPWSATTRSSPLTLQQRPYITQQRSPPLEHAHKRNVSDSPASSPKQVAEPFHNRSVSFERPGRSFVWRNSSFRTKPENLWPPRISSKKRAPSPLRTCTSSEDNLSPQDARLWEQTEEGGHNDSSGRSSNVPDTPQSQQSKSGSSISTLSERNLDKELPPLPAYLIPEPLNIRSPNDEHEVVESLSDTSAQDQTIVPQSRFSEWTTDRSRFSEWTVGSFDIEAFDLEEEDPDDQVSPTFSSICGDSSDAATPRRLSDQLLNEHSENVDEADAENQIGDVRQLDFDAIQQLRDAINKSGLPSHNTFRPLSSSLHDAASSSPTMPNFKLHQTFGQNREPLVAGDSTLVELANEFDYLGGILS